MTLERKFLESVYGKDVIDFYLKNVSDKLDYFSVRYCEDITEDPQDTYSYIYDPITKSTFLSDNEIADLET
jgi:hypothetical protein